MINKKTPATDFDVFLAKQLKNKTIKKYFDKYGKQLEISYQISQLRRRKKIGQKELAEKIGTINYEVVTRINPEIERIYTYGPKRRNKIKN